MPDAVAALLVDSRCELAECPLWCVRENVLWWTNIAARQLWRFRPADGDMRQWTLPDRLGSFALCESGQLLLGLAKGIHLAAVREDSDDIALTRLADVDADQPTLRINDGRCDRSGNFVFGTLNEDPARARIGSFHQYSQRHGLRRLALDRVAIPNSICFSPDGDVLYFCDSLQGKIMRCNYDSQRAQVGPTEVFVEVGAPASPDGAAIDHDGRLWSARWGAGQVVCHGRDGDIEHIVSVPASHVSCPTFTGANLDEICISSAWAELPAHVRAAEPHAGGIFTARVSGTKGLPESRFNDA